MAHFHGSSIAITGVAGFLGAHVARHFAAAGARVIGFDSAPSECTPRGDLLAYYQLSLPDPSLAGLLREHAPTLLIHCAGRASVPMSIEDPAADFSASTVLTFELLNALRLSAPSCRFVLLSSAAVYGNPAALPVSEDDAPAPLSPYGFHKWQCEQLCREFAVVYGLRTASGRIFSAYGPGLRRQVMWDICSKALGGAPLRLQGTGNESRDFIHAADIARGLLAIAERAPMTGETYNLASGSEANIAELASKILAALEVRKTVEFDGVVPAGNPLNWRADIRRISALGFRPEKPFDAGVESFAHWARQELGPP